MTAVVAIARVELKRFLRDRSNIFFVFVLPLLLVMLLGSQFGAGGAQGRVAVAGAESPLRTALTEALTGDEVTVTTTDPASLRTLVARGRVDLGVLVSEDAARAYDDGSDVDLEVVTSSQRGAPAAVERVRAAAARVEAEQGQVAALTAAGVPPDEARSALDAAVTEATPPQMRVVDVDDVAQELSGLGQFDLGAAGQTLLFVFLASLTGSTTLIQARRLGVMRRTLAAPVSSGQALLGQAAGRWVIAMFQGLYIMLATALLFGVGWGSVWVSGVVLAVFAAVASGAAMLIGSLVDSETAGAGIGVGVALVLAALGGSMMPLELFPDALRTVSLVTPHAWAYEAFAEIQRHDGTLVDVLPQLAVLTAMAVLLLALGSWALRRSTARAL